MKKKTHRFFLDNNYVPIVTKKRNHNSFTAIVKSSRFLVNKMLTFVVEIAHLFICAIRKR